MRKTCMKIVWIALVTLLIVLLICGLYWLSQMPQDVPGQGAAPASQPAPVLRIGLVPERDIFNLHRRYRALMDYLSRKLGQPIALATSSSYEGVLQDLADKRIDGAFLGSLVTVLAMDRLDVTPLVRGDGKGKDTYSGLLIVRDDSPIREVEQLAGKSIGMVRTTTAANLFPIWLLSRHGLLHGADRRIVWVGTHDDVAAAVHGGQIAAGAIKDRRLEALLPRHPEWKFRRLAQSKFVPENTLVLRGDKAETWGPALRDLLLHMHEDEQGRQTLEQLGSARFVVTRPEEYAPIFDMVDQLGEHWHDVNIGGPPPRRPASIPAPTSRPTSQPCSLHVPGRTVQPDRLRSSAGELARAGQSAEK
ncbi:MAG: Phosphate-import protein PhnD precursor [Planctomycetes bacterium ADurb.Bin126]|nr:MAG: Phosphate-import protein PhnD precursor [Planctomycetes bacterium ADurb.Bin126]